MDECRRLAQLPAGSACAIFPCMMRLLSGLIFALFAQLATPCRADQWFPPQPETYESPDKTYRLQVRPRELVSPLAYFSDKAKRREPAGGAKGQQQRRATATIEHLGADGAWTALWSGPLTNEVAPVDALIADGGRYVVTFDNWHSMGYGPNVVVIHDGQGRVIRAMALTDIVSEEYVFALGHSVSSIHWRGTPQLGPDDTVRIPIVVPGDRQGSEEETYVDAVIRLADGAVLSGASPEWRHAQAAAAKEAQSRRDYDERAREAFIAPLLGPSDNTERAWHDYLLEAFLRSAPRWKDDYPATTVLRDPSASDYAPSEGWLRDALLGRDYLRGPVAFASIAPFDHFVARMKAILAEAKPGSLRGIKVYIAAPTGTLPMFKAMFAKTGAQVHLFDPAVPIPQRPERLKAYLAAGA